MHHLIMRMGFQLTLDSEKDAYYLQHRISNYLRDILAVLQRVLDEVATDDQIIVIDKLEIDLGTTSMLSIRDDSWMLSLEEALREGLRKLMTGQGMEQELVTSVLRRAGRSGVFSQWLFSMRRGYLPWNAGKTDDGWYLKVLEAVATDDRIATELRQALVAEPTVLDRVVQQHAISFLVPLTEALTAKNQQQLMQVPDEMLTVVRTLDKDALLTKREVEKAVWKKVLMLAAAPAAATSASQAVGTEEILAVLTAIFFTPEQREWVVSQQETYAVSLPVLWPVFTAASIPVVQRVEAFTYQLPMKEHTLSAAEAAVYGGKKISAPKMSPDRIEPAVVKKEEKNIPAEEKGDSMNDAAEKGIREMAKKDSKPPPEKGRPAVDDVAGERTAQTEDAGVLEVKPETDVHSENVVAGEKIQPPSKDTPCFPKKKKTAIEVIGGEEIFVHHAGVILLHPFLHSFFKILGFVSEGRWLSTELQTRALYLIHYLATGVTEAHEHDLLMAKILCAWPLDEPVDAMVQLSEAELAEAENLLSAAISSWSILKSTSAAGLREGFLQRSGKLQVKGNDLLLLVENSSIDMLLDHLPWNLGIIKLPWMEHILRTEWR